MEKVFESVEEGGTVDVPLKWKCKLMVMYCRSIIWMFSVKTHTCPQQAVDIYVHRFKMEIKAESKLNYGPIPTTKETWTP